MMREFIKIVENAEIALTEEAVPEHQALPKVFYHATPTRNVEAILRDGLRADMKMWSSDHKAGVYLGDREAASEYMRHTGETGASADDIEFTMLVIDPAMLDPNKLRADDWEIDQHWDALENAGFDPEDINTIPWWASYNLCGQVLYAGDIPPSAIRVA